MAARFVVSAALTADLQRLAQAARELAGSEGRVEAVVLAGDGGLLAPEGVSPDELALQLGGLADALLVYEGMGAWLRGDAWAAALLDAIGEAADGVFVADAPAAREAVGRVAAVRGSSCASMCDSVARSGDGLVAKRSIYGGVADGTVSLPNAPAVCLFSCGKFEGETSAAAVAIESRQVAAPSYEIAQVSQEAVVKTVDLAGAPIVVSVGRGFAKADDLDLVQPLVKALGAELGCSRPIAEDFKWLPQERLVGLTGTSVNAGLYLALGISGQVQHLAGIKGAKVVVAVNNDAKAPIVRNADYVVVNDLYKVIPELLTALGSSS
jgi:electron transfer flavoprotein alpha subunit